MLMTSLWVIFFALFVVANTEIEKEDGVLVLTKDNFDDAIKTHEYILVEFYAPWCGHCKALAPEYASAAQALEAEGSTIKLGKVDATVHTELASKFAIQGYPTLKFFRSATPMEYNGPRKSDGIITWLKKKTGPALTVITTQDELTKLKVENKVVAAVFCSDEKSNAFEVMKFVANELDSVVFAHIKDDALKSALGVSGNDKLVLYKQFDDPMSTYEGKMTNEDLKKFITLELVPIVTEFTQESAQLVFESQIKYHLVAFSAKKSGSDYDNHMKLLNSVGRKLKGKMHVVLFNMDDEETLRIAEFFGVTKDTLPVFKMINLSGDVLKYQPEKADFTIENMESFAQDVLDGKIKPHLKSQEQADDWNSKPVKVLIGKTFHENVDSIDKAVFVEFYAPWCGHCKALAPIWDQLGEAFEKDSTIMIAKMDATENQLEDISVTSFPTLKFSPKGQTDFIDYKGERTLEALKKFVESNGKESGSPASDSETEQHDEL